MRVNSPIGFYRGLHTMIGGIRAAVLTAAGAMFAVGLVQTAKADLLIDPVERQCADDADAMLCAGEMARESPHYSGAETWAHARLVGRVPKSAKA